MFCPYCHTQIDDSSLVCPACHSNLDQTRVIPKLSGSWCSNCGALIPDGSTSCPKCGLSCKTPTNSNNRVSLNGEEHADASETQRLVRIESAIPSEPEVQDEMVYGKEGLPRTRVFFFAALASIIIVGGSLLLLTHPWDPDLNNTRATVPADTSTAGYPGAVDYLSGQDKNASAISVVSADEQTYAYLLEAYEQLQELDDEADALDELLDSKGLTGTSDERAAAYERATTLSLNVSNIASAISKIDVNTTGTYTEDKQNIATLASWLRNRIEAIEKAWSISASSDNPVADKSKILAPMQGNRTSDGSESYVNLFNANYESWAPSAPSS